MADFNLLSFTSVVIAYLVYRYLRKDDSHSRMPRPPGPTPKPLVGNTFDVPLKNHHLEYAKWGRLYQSDFVYATTIAGNILVLNKREDADELLEKRAKKYSGRPRFPVLPLIGQELNTAMLQYGDVWRQHRRIYHQYLRPATLSTHYDLQNEGVQGLLRHVLASPQGFYEHITLLAKTMPLRLMYGYNATSSKDPLVLVADESSKLIHDCVLPGATMVNVFPSLKYIPAWVPGASFHRRFAYIKRLVDETKRIPWEFTRRHEAEGTLPPCILGNVLQERSTPDFDEQKVDVALDAAYTAFGAAATTVATVMHNFIYAMVTHPEIQKKAQRLVDSVLAEGPSRLPTFDDRDKIPFIDAILRELYRWRPPGPLGLPHASDEDDTFKGYFIPKGTMVAANVWAMSRDESIYPNPEEFKPERFLDAKGALIDDDGSFIFGHGRRICPGRHFAGNLIWLMAISFLCAFDIQPAKGDKGDDIVPDSGTDDYGVIHTKTPFICRIVPRSERTRELITATQGQ